MADAMNQPKEELHVDANEAEHANAAPADKKSSSSGGGGLLSPPSPPSFISNPPLILFLPRHTGSKWAPSTYTNPAGEKIESTLGVVGKPVGDVMAKGAAPLGNIVDSVVGGVFRAGDMAQSKTGMGKDQDEAQKADQAFKEPMGGKEQTGGNPLGL